MINDGTYLTDDKVIIEAFKDALNTFVQSYKKYKEYQKIDDMRKIDWED